MTSKKALETIGMTKTNNIKSESLSKPRVMYLVKELRNKEIQTIKQDLARLEKLENENQTNKDLIKIQNEIIKIKEEENTKLKKVIELLKEYIGLKSVLDFDTYLMSLDKSDQNLLEEFFK